MSHPDPEQLLASLYHKVNDQRLPDRRSDQTQEQAVLGKAVPGITAVVYQEFFTKASAVAVELLQVHNGVFGHNMTLP